jgi:hypothetical protein
MEAAGVWIVFDQDQCSLSADEITKGMAIMRITSLFPLVFTAGMTERVLAADALKGEILAKRWCTSCHIVSADQQQGTAQAPPFQP